MKKLLLLVITSLSIQLSAQTLTTDPTFPNADKAVTVTFNASGTPLEGYTGDIYAHTGVTIDNKRWSNVIEKWGDNNTQPKLSKVQNNIYTLEIQPTINSFYEVNANDKVTELCFVFRSADAGTQTADLFIEVFEQGLSVSFVNPENNLLIDANTQINIEVAASLSNSLTLYVDETKITETTSGTITHTLTAANSGKHWIWAEAKDATSAVYDSVYYYIKEDVHISSIPHGVNNGINYINDSTVTLVLNAPGKDYVYLIGDFNDWDMSNTLETKSTNTTGKQVTATTWMMNRTPEGNHFWLTINNLTPKEEYGYQYLIDGEIRIADPYTEKVLDPWNDHYISSSTYPDLIPYPKGKTTEPVSVFQTVQTEFNWVVSNFKAPDADNMVIYEMLIRDFVENHSYKTIRDTLDYLQNLGINVLELMPVNEFEGNSSWGYNPSFYFAPDKYYGPKEELKKLIDECHKRGIAVVIDMVLNHSFGQSPMVRMYYNNGKVTADNPWYNVDSPNQIYQWGFDFNHERQIVKEFVDSVNSFWLNEYKVDGFRFDFTKGFTQTPGEGWDYDVKRVAILKRMADEIWERNPNAYVICEHLADNKEETILANYGLLLWGNMNHSYSEASMGWNESGKSDFSWISHEKRGWDTPNLVGYMESHDEERMMYKIFKWGNASGTYNTKEHYTAKGRIELAANLFIPIPGPKMIWQFGELGYDYSIDENGRVGEKPIRWDYWNQGSRKRIYEVMGYLNKLKTSEPAFNTSDFSLNVRNALKSIHLNHSDMNVAILGNFDVIEGTIDPEFQQTGTWYEYYSGAEVNISDINAEITLAPGEYRMYTTKKFDTPELSVSVNHIQTAKELIVFPNPVREKLYINSNNEIKEVSVYSSTGRKILYLNQLKTPIINTENLEDGLYIIRSTDSSGKQYSGKFIKQ